MKALQVFLSHTSDVARFPEDRPFVQAALDAVGRARMAPVDMRYFAARDGLPSDYCRQQVQSSDIYVGIIGFRYGSIVEGEGVSYTESEFLAATAVGLPRLVFLLADDARPPGATDDDLRLVRGFRKRLHEAGLLVREFKSSASLELEVFHALSELANQVPAISGSRAGSPALEEEMSSAAEGKRGIFTEPPSGLQVPAAAEVRYSLPPDTAGFTGREEEISQIVAAAADMATGMIAVRAIGGMPGVGKTALAVHAAYALRNRFPDRQLYINLHAHTPGKEPLLPKDALAGLLAAVGVDPRYLPGDLDGRAGLWCDRMAGQRALLVLDNAASSDQVIPLLPGSGDCLVLVTSRRHLGDLPGAVTYVLLDALSPQQAQEMFIRLAPRGVNSPGDAAEVVALAGYLPLPISLLARLFARHPSWTLADLAAETRADLLTLTAENSSVAAAFEVSYRHLDPARQRFFRLLGLHPGTTTDSYAAAVRWLRGDYPDAVQVLKRALDVYRDLGNRLGEANALDDLGVTRRLTGDYTGAAQVLEQALDVYRDLGERLGEANALDSLGIVQWLTGDYQDAAQAFETALHIYRDLGDRLGEATALAGLGIVQRLTSDYQSAAHTQEQALSIYRDLADRAGEAFALNNLGVVWRLTGEYQKAFQALETVLLISRALGDRGGETETLNDKGTLHCVRGEFDEAADCHRQALEIARVIASSWDEGHALAGLGRCAIATGRTAQGVGLLREAYEIFKRIGAADAQAVLAELNAATDPGSTG
jgi:tetratricopeptide (TPR) repeat protein